MVEILSLSMVLLFGEGKKLQPCLNLAPKDAIKHSNFVRKVVYAIYSSKVLNVGQSLAIPS